MAQITVVNVTRTSSGYGLASWARRHPLVAYFSLAFAGTWIFILPLLLSRGLQLFSLPDAVGLGFFVLSTYTGPFLAGVLLSGLTGGRESVRRLFKRMAQVRVGLPWYLLVILGYPIITIAAYGVALGQNTFAFLSAQWPLIFSVYLPMIVIDLFMPGIGEETGWRGFALPRLQQSYGPLAGSLILGSLHALWHLPVYFIPGMMTRSAFNPQFFVSNSLAIIALTLLWTWVFNHANGSLFFAILVHAASDANGTFLGRMFSAHPGMPFLPWFGPELFIPIALLVLLLTRGRLGYSKDRAPLL